MDLSYIDMDKGSGASTPSSQYAEISVLSIRLLMQGKEVGCIIGKKGDQIKRFRELSSARINISDGTTPERVVTISGTHENIVKAFDMICRKFDEDMDTSGVNPKPPITLRLIVPASQCGSIIGKGGCKIKEIRETTGASLSVASDMLPDSTERAVTISGTADALTKCLEQICVILRDSPPRGATIPYRPKPAALNPTMIYNGGAIATMPNNAYLLGSLPQFPTAALAATVPPLPPTFVNAQLLQALNANLLAPPTDFTGLSFADLSKISPASLGNDLHQLTASPTAATLMSPPPCMVTTGPPLINLPPLFSNAQTMPTAVPSNMSRRPSTAESGTTGQMLPGQVPSLPNGQSQQNIEIRIPNDLIGCIIGRSGAKINEIRQLSGANIKIATLEEGSTERRVLISGGIENINMALCLINTSTQLYQWVNTPIPATGLGCNNVAITTTDSDQLLASVAPTTASNVAMPTASSSRYSNQFVASPLLVMPDGSKRIESAPSGTASSLGHMIRYTPY